MILCSIILLIILVFIARQDIGSREVNWYFFVLAFAVIIARSLFIIDLKELLSYFLMNLLFVVIQFAVLFTFYAIKNRGFVNIINRFIGTGDLLFFIALCAAFSPVNFGLYLVTSLLLIIIIYAAMKVILKHRSGLKTIPLAGGLALTYMLMIITELFYKGLTLYNDTSIGELIIGR